MTFFKSLLLAIFATLFLTYVLGASFLELFDIHVYMDGESIEPLKAIGVSALASVILVLIALAIVLSVFGSLIFIAFLIAGSIVMVTFGVFWPVVLIAVIIWLVSRNKSEIQYNRARQPQAILRVPYQKGSPSGNVIRLINKTKKAVKKLANTS